MSKAAETRPRLFERRREATNGILQYDRREDEEEPVDKAESG